MKFGAPYFHTAYYWICSSTSLFRVQYMSPTWLILGFCDWLQLHDDPPEIFDTFYTTFFLTMNPKCNFQEGPVQVRILPNPVSIFLATGWEMINSNVSCFLNQQFSRLNLATYVGQCRLIKAHPQVPVISQFL